MDDDDFGDDDMMDESKTDGDANGRPIVRHVVKDLTTALKMRKATLKRRRERQRRLLLLPRSRPRSAGERRNSKRSWLAFACRCPLVRKLAHTSPLLDRSTSSF